jgi:large subunit ribosomal protein L17
MRHRVSGKRLSRDRGHRKALFKNLIKALVIHGEVKTTEAKAKTVRRLVEKVITKGKIGTLHTRRLIEAFLQDKKVVNRLVDEVAPLFKDRPGGYTRIVRLGKRKGDDAMVVKLELVAKPEPKEAPKAKKTKTAKSTPAKKETKKSKGVLKRIRKKTKDG